MNEKYMARNTHINIRKKRSKVIILFLYFHESVTRKLKLSQSTKFYYK